MHRNTQVTKYNQIASFGGIFDCFWEVRVDLAAKKNGQSNFLFVHFLLELHFLAPSDMSGVKLAPRGAAHLSCRPWWSENLITAFTPISSWGQGQGKCICITHFMYKTIQSASHKTFQALQWKFVTILPCLLQLPLSHQPTAYLPSLHQEISCIIIIFFYCLATPSLLLAFILPD